jgi:ADP-heptose:LPS heptosyltransferase
MATKEKIVFRAMVHPGDLLMLTAALRDLHLAYPDRFISDVDTTCRQVWDNNPNVQPINRIETHHYLNVGYPPYSHSEINPPHLTTRYHQRISELLGVEIKVTKKLPEVYLSEEEKDPGFLLSLGLRQPYWVVIAGAKYDTTTKWWNPAYYQEVVDRLGGKIQFVQCGNSGDWHKSLKNVVNMVGKTDIRQLTRLMYHADGVLCPVTFAMHLAAATPTRNGQPRGCVVIVGGRESPSLIQYPNHTLLHTIDQLSCCEKKGCWRYVCQETHVRQMTRSRCDQPVQVTPQLKLPLCMETIKPAQVVEAILRYHPEFNSKPPAATLVSNAPALGKRFAHTHPRHLQELYEHASGINTYKRAVRSAEDFDKLLQSKGPVDLMLIGNLMDDSKQLAERCERHGIDRVYGEFGWFPHYRTVHADPVGYAWESSLCHTKFSMVTPRQRLKAAQFRERYLPPRSVPLPDGVRPPYILWPLQLIGDRVNKYDLNVPDWYGLLLWARQLLPVGYQLVIKHHPVSPVQPRIECVRYFPDIVILDKSAPLHSLIQHCAGVVGCNSTVLLESRLLYNKPTWAYGRSWYTGHPDLVFPVNGSKHLPHIELLGKPLDDPWLSDYTDWFLCQLLARQYSTEEAKRNPGAFLKWIHRRTRNAYASLGEDAYN